MQSALHSMAPGLARALGFALFLSIPVAGFAQNPQTFTAPDNTYTFQFPEGFALKPEFADGTGDLSGVTASTMNNGDVNITFLGPRDPGDIADASAGNRQTIVDEFTRAIAVLPSIRLKSSAMTTMLGQPAVDMTFTNRRFKNVAINRYVFTVVAGKAYNFECIYREDKMEQFAPACDLAIATVRLKDGAARAEPATTAGEDHAATTAGSCSRLALNRRAMQVTELTSGMLVKDQSPSMIARVRKAHDAAMAIDARAGENPSAQDCEDIDAIIGTLK